MSASDHHKFDDFGSDASTVAFSDASLDWKVIQMSASEFDQDHHKFDDFGSDASTVAFSDASLDSEFSQTNSHGTVEDFLDRWTCVHCEIVPAMQSAERMCQMWIEDNESHC